MSVVGLGAVVVLVSSPQLYVQTSRQLIDSLSDQPSPPFTMITLAFGTDSKRWPSDMRISADAEDASAKITV